VTRRPITRTTFTSLSSDAAVFRGTAILAVRTA
jgi:hypothetical protein